MSKKDKSPVINNSDSIDYQRRYNAFWTKNDNRQQAIIQVLSILDAAKNKPLEVQEAALTLTHSILSDVEDNPENN